MARLDPIIDKLFKDSGEELLIETGGGVNMRTATGLLPVLKQNLTTQQIIGALAELVPAEQRSTFPPEGSSSFPYSAPAGSVQVRLEHVQGHLKVSVVPFSLLPAPEAVQEEKLELASPFEMLEMAAQVAGPVLADPAPPLELETGSLELEPLPGAFPAPAPAASPPTPAPAPGVARPAPAVPAPTVRMGALTPAPISLAPAPAPAPAGPATLPPIPVQAAPVAAPVRAAPGPATLPPIPIQAAPVAAPAHVTPGPATLPPVPVAAAPVAAPAHVSPGPATLPPVPAPAAPPVQVAAPPVQVAAPPVPAPVAATPAPAVVAPPVHVAPELAPQPTPAPVPVAVPTPAPVLVPTPAPVAEVASPAAAPAPAVEAVTDRTLEAEGQMLALMKAMLERGASDLHLSSETVPHMRIDGDMVPLAEYGRISHERLKAMVFSVAPEKNRKQWEEIQDTDFAHETATARFRVNVFEDRKGIGAVMRQIPNTIRTAEEIGLTKHVLDMCFLSKGLVLVTGPTGSGKSTTLAALIDYINRHREDHIITVEDPIEFVHKNKSCLVNQREVGVHTRSFKNALRAALREDPDVVLVGEMRDLETIATAIETAETGHLVFGTLHTNTAASTVDRIIDQFPADRQAQIRMMLSESLKAVIAQTLCKRIGGGRVAAQEVLLVTGPVSNLIREGKTFQIPSVMQTSRGQGMVTLNDALLDLVKRKVVDPNEALSKSVNRAELRSMLERAGFKADGPAETPAPTK
ncbi:type IV pilus twitching motility protein PilT [Hyalangium rubrum]|uniref:PilT/PilU family type 4a pilus ATPase n=1 Tax=Hyalangium rubrum TaxID=3103134 RepID=A0ABU5GZ21_9BACT|nr:PilT/PilU family type 4a pilus ATPase [Hyalangium sp. s54d21]MDY7226117.1 PilT/PilU family type 4a pilus ATPase [Hyalangium sp. s54d21]